MNSATTAETRGISERSGAFSGRIEAAPSRVLEALKPGPDHPLSRRRAEMDSTPTQHPKHPPAASLILASGGDL